MSRVALLRNLGALSDGIELCLREKQNLAALVLIYTAMDTVGWLDSEEPYATRGSFVQWVDRYVASDPELACTGLDLYAARCGLLHTFTGNSRLSEAGDARRVCYAWGLGMVQTLNEAISDDPGLIALQVEDLYAAWLQGIATFLSDLEGDEARRTRVQTKAANFFSLIDC